MLSHATCDPNIRWEAHLRKTKRTFLKLIIATLLCLGRLPAWAGDQPPIVYPSDYYFGPVASQQLGEMFGFVYTQRRMVEHLIKLVPSRATELEAGLEDFDRSFEWPEARLRQIVASAERNAEAERFMAPIIEQALKAFDGATPDIANKYAEYLHREARGEVEPEDTLKGLYWLKFGSRPKAELSEGRTAEFRSGFRQYAGKAFSMSVPFSWKKSLGTGRGLTQQWTSQNGSGDMTLLVQIRAPSPLTSNPSAEIQKLLSSKSYKDLIPSDATLLQRKQATIDGVPSLLVDSISPEATDKSVDYMRAYVILPPKAHIFFGCRLNASSRDFARAEKRYGLLKEVCDEVANSIRIEHSSN